MQCAFWIVERRCAMAMVVLPLAAWSRASCTTFSELESSAEVASSRSSTFGSRINARAIAMRSADPLVSLQHTIDGPRTKERDIRTFLAAGQLRALATNLCIESTLKNNQKKKRLKGKLMDRSLWQFPHEIEDICLPTGILNLLLRHLLLTLDSAE
jgi:hypothetical protein